MDNSNDTAHFTNFHELRTVGDNAESNMTAVLDTAMI